MITLIIFITRYVLYITKTNKESNNNSIESVTEHLQLPCTVREEGCQTSAKTYVWRDKET